MDSISDATVAAVLERLDVAQVTVDRAGLDSLYLAWCRAVPFDNLVKRIDLATGEVPFRNVEVEDFFALWLEHGCGGTCWPSSRALGALLSTIGFDARLGSAAMADEFTGPVHSHGTVLVRIDDDEFWVDSSMLTDRPVPLVRGDATRLEHPLRPVRVEPVADLWRVYWTGGVHAGEMGCLLLADDVDGSHYADRYEWSRGMSPFNASVYATRNAADQVLSVAAGHRVVLDATGLRSRGPLDAAERRAVLIDDFGYSEAIVALLPPDDPSPGVA